MENFKAYLEETKNFIAEVENFNKKQTKASAKRLRKHMDNLSKLKVTAKKDLISPVE